MPRTIDYPKLSALSNLLLYVGDRDLEPFPSRIKNALHPHGMESRAFVLRRV